MYIYMVRVGEATTRRKIDRGEAASRVASAARGSRGGGKTDGRRERETGWEDERTEKESDGDRKSPGERLRLRLACAFAQDGGGRGFCTTYAPRSSAGSSSWSSCKLLARHRSRRASETGSQGLSVERERGEFAGAWNERKGCTKPKMQFFKTLPLPI